MGDLTKDDIKQLLSVMDEALIIAEAGAKGAVTIATNMAGRGTDIKLGGNPEFRARKRAGTDDEGTIEGPIGRHPIERKKMAINEKNGKPAITHYKVLERFGNYTYMQFKLETGRTHQIRVHMQELGHQIRRQRHGQR